MRAGIVLAAVLSLCACVHLNDVMRAHDGGQGMTKVYDVSEQRAWAAALAVMRWAGAEKIEQHPDHHSLYAHSGMGEHTYGTRLGAWVEPVDAGHTRVTVVSKREAITDMTEEGFHKDFAKAIALLEAGKPLPPKEP